MQQTGRYKGKYERKKSRNRRFCRLLFVGAIGLAIVFGILWGGLKLFASKTKPDALIKYIGEIPVYEDFISEKAAGRILQKREIKYIVIHETGNTSAGANAEAHNSFIHKNSMNEEHSWHYTVDDKQIYHHIPDDEPAYHAGDRLNRNGGNLNGIGIEICVAEDVNYDLAVEHAARLTAQLLHAYDLDPEKAVKKHQDFSGKICPQIMIEEGGWETFLESVRVFYDEAQDSTA